MTEPSALTDLRTWVRDGLERGGDLLSAGEVLIAQRLLAVDGAVGLLLARLHTRKRSCFPASDLADRYGEDAWRSAEALVDLDLADHLVPPATRAAHSTVAELRAACVRLGLRRSGAHAALVERLAQVPRWDDRRWVRLRHRELVQRLGRFATLRRHPDPAQAVIERLGHVAWPEYALTDGPVAHRNRAALLAWEHALARRDEADGDELLALLRTEVGSPASTLDLRGSLERRLLARAYELERAGEPARARAWLEALGPERAASSAVRRARCLEAEERPAEALQVLLSARETPGETPRLDVHRAGRRVARALRRAWPPAPPLPPLRERHLRLEAGEKDAGRPTWVVDGEAFTIEAAVVRALQRAGRRAVHAEGGLWRTIFALVTAEIRFLPVRGALPVTRLDAPLDDGSPAFVARRAGPIATLLAALRAGAGGRIVAEADARWRGKRLRGADWTSPAELLCEVAANASGAALAQLVERLLVDGDRAVAGLPDLVILPGGPATLDGAHPSGLASTLFLAELKGPTDALRDEQRVWIGLLSDAGLRTELWHVAPNGTAGVH